MNYSKEQHDDAWAHRELWDIDLMSESLDLLREIELKQSEYCKVFHRKIKDIVGEDKMIVFKFPVTTYGNYVEFTEAAVCKNILLSHNRNGWCDKPVQPYSGMYDHYLQMADMLVHGQYELKDNPIKDHKLAICV